MDATHCHRCGNELSDEGHCRTCQAARSRRWYADNSTLASARRGAAAKLSRRLQREHLDALRDEIVVGEQDGCCACCGLRSKRLGLDWSIDQATDDGMPLVRGAVCRSCKIAIGRLIAPSRFVLQPKVLERTERYLKRPWRDPFPILQRIGLKQNLGAQVAEREIRLRRSETDRTVEWLESLGIGR